MRRASLLRAVRRRLGDRRQGGAGWRARVAFKRELRRDGFAPRVSYTLPVEAVERVDQRPPRRWHFENGHFEEVWK